MKDSFCSRVFSFLSRHEWLNFLPDKVFLEMRYWIVKREKIDWDHPKNFNEKIQWLKLYNRQPDYIKMVDKYAVKKYVSQIIGSQYIVPTIGGPWNSCDEIDWECLPSAFVLKCTHNSGDGVAVITDKSQADLCGIKKRLQKALSNNFFYAEREWPYKFVKPQILCEKYLVDHKTGQLMDYKIHVFMGVPRIIQVDFDRFTGHKRNLYDVDWNYIEGEIHYPTHPEITIERPEKLSEMLQLAAKLADHMPYVRVDFYVVDEEIYFGELTFYHGGGLEEIKPAALNRQMGEWIQLPKEMQDRG